MNQPMLLWIHPPRLLPEGRADVVVHLLEQAHRSPRLALPRLEEGGTSLPRTWRPTSSCSAHGSGYVTQAWMTLLQVTSTSVWRAPSMTVL